jgi:hypothetical protein
MSAFQVSVGTIDRVVSAIMSFDDNIVMLGIVCDPDTLGCMLIELNQEALRQRYGDVPEAFEYAYRERTDEHSTLAKLKAVACLRYQCSEGNVPTQPLYKLLEAVEDQLRHFAARRYNTIASKVEELPAYDALPWDFRTL